MDIKKEHKLHIPDLIRVQIKNMTTDRPLEVENIMVGIRLFAFYKNDYQLAPFFTDHNGVIEITKQQFEITARSVLNSGIKEYYRFEECSSLVEFYILSYQETMQLIEERKLRGISSEEEQFYQTKETLLKRIVSDNNHLVQPFKRKVVFDQWVGAEVEVVLYTNTVKDFDKYFTRELRLKAKKKRKFTKVKRFIFLIAFSLLYTFFLRNLSSSFILLFLFSLYIIAFIIYLAEN